MTPAEYIRATGRTESMKCELVHEELATPEIIQSARVLHMAMGLSGEGGETIDEVKKHLFYGKKLDRTNVLEEMGDALWYISRMLDILGATFEQVFDMNIAKLYERFPEKFDSDKALVRDLRLERKALDKHS